MQKFNMASIAAEDGLTVVARGGYLPFCKVDPPVSIFVSEGCSGGVLYLSALCLFCGLL